MAFPSDNFTTTQPRSLCTYPETVIDFNRLRQAVYGRIAGGRSGRELMSHLDDKVMRASTNPYLTIGNRREGRINSMQIGKLG